MVQLTLTPWKGNHQRFFPHTGHLGISAVTVTGLLRTALEEDGRPLKASAVLVRLRCYEVDKQQPGTSSKPNGRKTRVLYEVTQTLWRKAEGEEFSPLGDFTAGFKLALPVNPIGGVSTVTFKNYRAWWQVEAVVLHKPSSIFGSRTLVAHPIPLTRHEPRASSPSPPIRWSSQTAGALQTRGFRYDVHLPESDYAPADDFIVDLNLSRDEQQLEVVKVQVTIDRTLDLSPNNNNSNTNNAQQLSQSQSSKAQTANTNSTGSDEDVPEPPPEEEPLLSPQDAEDRYAGRPISKGLSSVFRRGNSNSKQQSSSSVYPTPPSPPNTDSSLSYFNSKPLPATPSSSSSSSSSVAQILSMEADDIQWGTKLRLRGNVPPQKSFFRYSLGETMRTQLAAISFTVSVKITVKRPGQSAEVVALQPQTINMRSVRAINQNSTPEWSTQPKPPKNGSSESLNREPLRAMA